MVLAISTWGSQFSNKKLIMHVDNEALVSVINKQTSKSKNVMTLVRTLVLCLLQNNTDGVQLSQIGTDIFLNTLSGALRTFITSSDTVYPKQW